MPIVDDAHLGWVNMVAEALQGRLLIFRHLDLTKIDVDRRLSRTSTGRELLSPPLGLRVIKINAISLAGAALLARVLA